MTSRWHLGQILLPGSGSVAKEAQEEEEAPGPAEDEGDSLSAPWSEALVKHSSRWSLMEETGTSLEHTGHGDVLSLLLFESAALPDFSASTFLVSGDWEVVAAGLLLRFSFPPAAKRLAHASLTFWRTSAEELLVVEPEEDEEAPEDEDKGRPPVEEEVIVEEGPLITWPEDELFTALEFLPTTIVPDLPAKNPARFLYHLFLINDKVQSCLWGEKQLKADILDKVEPITFYRKIAKE